MDEEQNDASSNPNAEEHLPTAGEFRTLHVPEDGTITDIDDEDEYPDDMNDDFTELDPNEPAIPHASGDQSY